MFPSEERKDGGLFYRYFDPTLQEAEIGSILKKEFIAVLEYCPEHPLQFLASMEQMRKAGESDAGIAEDFEAYGMRWTCLKHDAGAAFVESRGILTIMPPPSCLEVRSGDYGIRPLGELRRVGFEIHNPDDKRLELGLSYCASPSGGVCIYLGPKEWIMGREGSILLGNDEVSDYIGRFMRKAAELNIPFRSLDEYASLPERVVFNAFFNNPDFLYDRPRQYELPA